MPNQELHGTIRQSAGLSGKVYPRGPQGNGIEKIEKTETSGLVDTYTIYYTNGTTENYTVTNGEKGDTGDRGPQRNTRRTTVFKVFKVFKVYLEKIFLLLKHIQV